MPHVHCSYAPCEIYEAVAVHVREYRPFRLLDERRKAPGNPPRYEPLVARHHLPTLWTRHLRDQLYLRHFNASFSTSTSPIPTHALVHRILFITCILLAAATSEVVPSTRWSASPHLGSLTPSNGVPAGGYQNLSTIVRA